jgi:hypothetical protein
MANTRFILRTPGGRLAVGGGGLTIGRDPNNSIVVADQAVSRHHARVFAQVDGLILHDQGSINGTFLNSRRITGDVALHQSDEVRVGTYLMHIECAPIFVNDPRGAERSRPSSHRMVVILAAGGLAVLCLLLIPVFTMTPSPQSMPGAINTPGSAGVEWADVFERAAPDVVVINNRTDRGSGTGVYFDPRHVLTNAHVVATARTVEVTLLPTSGRGSPVTQMATVLARDSGLDLAVLTLVESGDPHVVFGPTQDARVGDEVMAIGEPLGLAWTATFGRVSAFRQGTEFRRPSVETVIQFDAAVNPGNSGGPLLTHGGKVIGLVTFGGGSSGAQGLNFAIGGDQLWTRAREWIARGSTT